MPDVTPLNLLRKQLGGMTPDHRSLRALEQLIQKTNTGFPDDINALYQLSADIETIARNASSKANSALASIAMSAPYIVEVSANYTVLRDNETVLVDATSGEKTITIQPSALGRYVNVIKTDSTLNRVLITSASQIAGATTAYITVQYESVEVIGGATAYYIR